MTRMKILVQLAIPIPGNRTFFDKIPKYRYWDRYFFKYRNSDPGIKIAPAPALVKWQTKIFPSTF